MENDRLFNLMEKMYIEMQELKKDVKKNIEKIESIEKTVMRVEENYGRKLEALLDGYRRNSEHLSSIEKEVSKHEEIILKRVK